MPDEEHLKILNQGVAVWNEWREKNPELHPDLNGANLSRRNLIEVNLSGASLTKANFSKAKLTKANLSKANLHEANLEDATLEEANLSEADLGRVDFGWANLSMADLQKASLHGAMLDDANLSKANLHEANLQQVYFSRTNLTEAHLNKAYLHGKDLRGAFLNGATLSEANLSWADLRGAFLNKANLSWANLHWADLRGAFLKGADLSRANLHYANLSGAHLEGAYLQEAYLREANLSGADLRDANLIGAQLFKTDLRSANLTGSGVYGVSVWGIKVNECTKQHNLTITTLEEPQITVDNIEVAQFIYLLLNNQAIRKVIDTITSKAVLILGRFTDGERKAVLDAIRDELRNHNYLPIMFDFPPLDNQTTIETIKTLADMCRFVVADLTDARSVLMELGVIVPDLPSVAVRLLIKKSAPEYGMLDFIRKFSSVVEDTFEYENEQEVIASIKEKIIVPAEAKVRKLRPRPTAEGN